MCAWRDINSDQQHRAVTQRPVTIRGRSIEFAAVALQYGTAMSQHVAIIHWTRKGPDFVKGRYSREHTWSFDGGVTVPASPSPSVVPAPWSNPANVDPEEAFVAAVASCHMLTFLWLASREGFIADCYRDESIGAMTRNERGVPWVSTITLRPEITWSGVKQPSNHDVARLHQLAHEQCFISNSIRTEVIVQGGAWLARAPNE